jgi:hypothetical protein
MLDKNTITKHVDPYQAWSNFIYQVLLASFLSFSIGCRRWEHVCVMSAIRQSCVVHAYLLHAIVLANRARQETANSVEISVCRLGIRTAFQLGVGDFKFFICCGVAQTPPSSSCLTETGRSIFLQEIFQYDRLHSANDPKLKIFVKQYYWVPFDVSKQSLIR